MTRSESLFEEAKRYIPGGVNSPVRSFGSVSRLPLYISSGRGSKIYDVDGTEYIDYVLSWGPLILGHAPERVTNKVQEYSGKGTSFGANTEIEIELARLIVRMVPSIDMVRMVNSGTEATMSTVRLARGFTNRDKIVKFEGCYHGHGDSFLIKAGSGVLTLGIPGSPGITTNTAQDTLIAGFNDIESVKSLVSANRGEIAAVVLEPIMGNAGVIPPQGNFLQELAEIAGNEGIILIFDEVITGFRVALGGAQELYGVTPDLTCLGKIIGGGLPVGAFGGRREIMEYLAPLGPVYQAGTLSGNPLAMAAGHEMLTILNEGEVYQKLELLSGSLEDGMARNLERLKLKYTMNRVGSMMSFFFTEQSVHDYASATTSDTALFTHYFNEMLGSGIYLAPSQFETSFLSTAHTQADVEKTVEAHYNSLKKITGS